MESANSDAALGESVQARAWRTYDDPSLPPILEAALLHFKERGYHATTIREIASQAGVTVPALYYHYGSKEGILFALLDIAMDDLLARIRGGVGAAGNDTERRYSNYVIAVCLHNTYRHDLARLHGEFRFLDSELRARYLIKRMIAENILVDLLIVGADEGIFRAEDPRFTSCLVRGMLSGIIDWYSKGDTLSAQDIASRYARIAVRVVLAHGAVVSPSAGHLAAPDAA